VPIAGAGPHGLVSQPNACKSSQPPEGRNVPKSNIRQGGPTSLFKITNMEPREWTCTDDSPLNNGWGYNQREPEEEPEEEDWNDFVGEEEF